MVIKDDSVYKKILIIRRDAFCDNDSASFRNLYNSPIFQILNVSKINDIFKHVRQNDLHWLLYSANIRFLHQLTGRLPVPGLTNTHG